MPSQFQLQGPVRFFFYVATATVLVAVLALGRVVLIPLTLAAMMAFILNTPVTALESRGLHRVASVAVVLLVALALLGAFGYALSRQFTDFAAQMPQYSASIKSKLATLRATRNRALGKIEETVEKVSHELDKQEEAKPASGATAQDSSGLPVSVVSREPNDVERMRILLEPILRPITTAGVVLILTVFMLMRREDLRNRLIRLVGQGRVTVTTRTLDEAGHRISTFLFTQSIINAGFGILVTAGLLVIGVPYALLWGVTAACLRFVPYLGSLLALLMPAALGFVGSPGWRPTIETVALFLVLDVLTANFIEPVLIGAHTGISSLALLVSAMFWTWLWGPVGLLLSTPFTVCLAATGKHVPGMEFFAVLLGDEPPLEPDVTLYQRLLAGDEDEASDILDQEFAKDAADHVFDHVVGPTLLQAGRDRMRDDISAAEQEFVVRTIRDILRHRFESSQSPETLRRGASLNPRRILGVPARNESDALALEMLSHLAGDSWTIERLTTATLASEVLLAIEKTAPDLLCIAALPPGGFNHIRYLCKRIHTQFPSVPIWVLRTDVDLDARKMADRLGADGAQHVATSFAVAATELAQHIFPAAASVQAAATATPAEPAEESPFVTEMEPRFIA